MKESSVAGAIVSYAEGENVDLIVVGTRGKSGIKNMLLGSVNLIFEKSFWQYI